MSSPRPSRARPGRPPPSVPPRGRNPRHPLQHPRGSPVGDLALVRLARRASPGIEGAAHLHPPQLPLRTGARRTMGEGAVRRPVCGEASGGARCGIEIGGRCMGRPGGWRRAVEAGDPSLPCCLPARPVRTALPMRCLPPGECLPLARPWGCPPGRLGRPPPPRVAGLVPPQEPGGVRRVGQAAL